jgi:hypothetical protein
MAVVPEYIQVLQIRSGYHDGDFVKGRLYIGHHLFFMALCKDMNTKFYHPRYVIDNQGNRSKINVNNICYHVLDYLCKTYITERLCVRMRVHLHLRMFSKKLDVAEATLYSHSAPTYSFLKFWTPYMLLSEHLLCSGTPKITFSLSFLLSHTQQEVKSLIIAWW